MTAEDGQQEQHDEERSHGRKAPAHTERFRGGQRRMSNHEVRRISDGQGQQRSEHVAILPQPCSSLYRHLSA